MATSVDSPPRYPRRRTLTPAWPLAALGRRWRALALGLVLAGPAVALSGCGDDDASGSSPVVVVVGDSLLFQAGPEVRAGLRAAGWTPVLDGQPGATITGPSDVADVHWPERINDLMMVAEPDAVVVELGTNGCGPDCPGLDEAIADVLDAIGDGPEVRWFDVREDAPEPADPAAVNAALRRAAESHDGLEIVDYDARFNGRGELLDPDGVHLTPDGERAFAELVVDALP